VKPGTVQQAEKTCSLEEETRDPVLSVEHLSKRFAGVEALRGVSLEVPEGSIFGLIGPNGAGKTTLFDVVSGLLAPTAGRVRLGSRDVTGQAPHRVAQLGLSRTFQNSRLFGHLSVLETVLVGQHRRAEAGLRGLLPCFRREHERALRAEARELLHMLRLEVVAERPAGTLSYGDQRRLEIARALATSPRLLLLDEPAAGMGPAESIEMSQDIERIRARGCTVLLIEHQMNVIMRVCDRVAVLSFGQKVAEGTPAEIQRDSAVVECYLGVGGQQSSTSATARS